MYVPEKDIVRIPVKNIVWDLAEGRYTPEVPAPDEVVVTGNGVSYIDLVPYGGTQLRLTVFPVILEREVYGTAEYVWSEEKVSSGIRFMHNLLQHLLSGLSEAASSDEGGI